MENKFKTPIQQIEKASEYYAHNYFDMHETNSYKELKRGFEAGVEWARKNILIMDKWILISDRLPDNGQEVLAAFVGWDDLIFQRTLEYDNENNEWFDWSGIDYYTVLAWQPLPDDYVP